MGENNGNFIVIRHKIKHTRINAHVMAKRAERIEAVILIYEIIVRLVVNRRVNGADRIRESIHYIIQAGVQLRIFIDPVLSLHLLKEFLKAVIIVIFHSLIGLLVLSCCLNCASDNTAPACICRWRRNH